MRKVTLHIKRLFRKFWFFIALTFVPTPFLGLLVLMLMTTISLLFFDDPIDVDKILKNFSEEQFGIISSEKMDETISDDEYLTLLANYQSHLCPMKFNKYTTWVGSSVSETAYIYWCKIKTNAVVTKEMLREQLIVNKDSIQTKRLVRSNRKLVFSYTFCKTGEKIEIVFTPEDLV